MVRKLLGRKKKTASSSYQVTSLATPNAIAKETPLENNGETNGIVKPPDPPESVKKDDNMTNNTESAQSADLPPPTARPKSSFGEVCRMEESPYRIMKLAASGNMKEFEKLYKADNNRLTLQDPKGLTVLHHAASKSKTNIMEFIFDNPIADINAQDKRGHTPLHVAAEKDQAVAVTLLLKHGAKSDILNLANMAPVHVAADTGCAKSLQALTESGSVDLDLPGESGSTPLHFAALKDTTECAKVLLAAGAGSLTPDRFGYYPIHVACREASVGVLDILLDHALKLSLTETMLNLRDKDGNTAIHAAVGSGRTEPVSTCLRYGASVEVQQNDQATPVHMACAQRSLTMVRIMVEATKDKGPMVLFIKDAMDMTPLHTAALFDQIPIVEYLITMGSNVNCQDKAGRTPLLIAASNKAWATVRALLEKGANMLLTDNKGRNFLHLTILNGAKIQDLDKKIFEDSENLLNQTDEAGCTPLHYASKMGNVGTIETLITLGAFLNIKNKEKQAPLHFAASCGRLNTCMRLLESLQGSHIINETDGRGMTALHLAAENGHVKVVQYLLQRGALLQRDNFGNSPLHLAAENGYTQTMKLILASHFHILNALNQDGASSLHVAARCGHARAVSLLLTMQAELMTDNDGCYFLDHAITNHHKDVARAVVSHDRWREVMDLKSIHHCCPLIGLIRNIPEVCLTVLDRCVSVSDESTKSKNFYKHYDFRYLQCSQSQEEEQKKTGADITPMLPLNVMVQFNRVECLSHPVCVTFLRMKWRAYGFWIHVINIGWYSVFLALLTAHVCIMQPIVSASVAESNNGTNYQDAITAILDLEMSQFHRLALLSMSIFCLLNLIKEIVQMFQQKVKYFTDFNNLLEWILYITTAIFVVPPLFGFYSFLTWQCGAVAVFLTWFNLLLYLQRFDMFGIYVVMFLEILKTLLQVIVVFSILIIAFGLSFYMLLVSKDIATHSTPTLSMIRTFVMMLGDLDYTDTFVGSPEEVEADGLRAGVLAFIFLIAFILLMPILLMNLLIGLAVGDIEAVQRNARLKRLAMQVLRRAVEGYRRLRYHRHGTAGAESRAVKELSDATIMYTVELHTDLERKLPQRLLRYVDKTDYKIYTQRGSFLTRMIQRLFREAHDQTDLSEDTFHPRCDVQHVILIKEMQTQKRRMKDLSAAMEKQHELLRLVVQKMEIRSEAEDKDAGDHSTASTDMIPGQTSTRTASGAPGRRPSVWNSNRLRQQILTQSNTSYWSHLSQSKDGK